MADPHPDWVERLRPGIMASVVEAELDELTPRRDPFRELPIVPGDWRVLRTLLQLLIGLALILGPMTLLSPPITRSTLGVYVVPIGVIAVGWYVRRKLSRVAGTLIVVGMVTHLIGWVALYFYGLLIVQEFQ